MQGSEIVQCRMAILYPVRTSPHNTALNISFTSGAVNSFILFIQLPDTLFINASGKIEFSTGIHVLRAGYRLIYGIFNLDFFNIEPLSFYIFGNATVVDVLAFKYVTIIYTLILGLSVIAS